MNATLAYRATAKWTDMAVILPRQFPGPLAKALLHLTSLINATLINGTQPASHVHVPMTIVVVCEIGWACDGHSCESDALCYYG